MIGMFIAQGKYMEILFNLGGDPIGGRVTNCKSLCPSAVSSAFLCINLIMKNFLRVLFCPCLCAVIVCVSDLLEKV